ncbi:MAG: type VI secretion system tip protein VgrG [Xanthomonadaceae bacterium]|jgi:type VI secretion system VgrG family protein|nr:type VI secretion system tip protein VgrG [Xanthomonadaceae bacterium]
MGLVETILSVLSAPGQRERLLRLHTPLGEGVLTAESFSGYESIDGGGYCFEATALSADSGLDLQALLGKAVLLEVLTARSASDLRPLHGHVTALSCEGSNGGLTRYRLRIEPWLSLLRHRVDSYVFQDKRVVEIVDDVLSDYGSVAPSWRWELGDAAVYSRRSLTTQYQESDFDFLSRLLAEEGIFYWFEHEGDPSSASLGCHTLVLSDHGGAHRDLGTVRYHRSDATERSDSVQQWNRSRRWHPALLERSSWDYRSLNRRAVSAETEIVSEALVEDLDTSGPYAYRDLSEGERRVRQHLEARLAYSQRLDGSGSWRELSAGGRFGLTQYPGYRGTPGFVCLRVEHQARNNLGAEVIEALEQTLGRVSLEPLELPPALRGLAEDTERLPFLELPEGHFYGNRFVVLPEAVAYRPRTRDGHGLWLHPKPTATGTQSAIVVSDGEPLHTDRDHRIKVQFAWQRGSDSSSAEEHPGGEENAPGDTGAWTWVRVSSTWAGENWGGVFLPRRGQEVLVGFLEGDIDRPVVLGALYNGRGQEDAQHNRIPGGNAGATGNAAAWFDGNDHAAVQVGFKSQELRYSQEGTGGYQWFRLDDTPGEGRAQLGTTQHLSSVTLGHQKGGRDNVRAGDLGFGMSVSTQASGALRAGSGLLLTTESGRDQLSAAGVRTQQRQAEQLLETLNASARHQGAILPEESEALAAREALGAFQKSLAARQSGDAGGEIGGGAGEVPGWDKPLLVCHGEDGLLSVTPSDQVWVSGTQTSVVSGMDVNWLSQGAHVVSAAGGVVLYTQGGTAPAKKANQERGIALHAAQGNVSARSHREEVRISAQHSVRVASVQSDVELNSPNEQVLLTAQGAYLKLGAGLIELGAPGVVEFKSTRRVWQGPKSASSQVVLPSAGLAACDYQLYGADKSGAALVPIGDAAAAGAGSSSAAAADRIARGGASGSTTWTVGELLDVLCPQDKAVVDDLAKTNVEVASQIYYDDRYYDGTQWTTKRFYGGGSWDGSTLLMLDRGAAQDAATTAYHELVHKHQPASMSMLDKEIQAYSRTEQWAIDRGYSGQGIPEFRTTGTGGAVVPDVAKITEFVKREYPLPGNPGPRPIEVLSDGKVRLSDGSVRAPLAGDAVMGDEQVTGWRQIPRAVWKCP